MVKFSNQGEINGNLFTAISTEVLIIIQSSAIFLKADPINMFLDFAVSERMFTNIAGGAWGRTPLFHE